jgi:hypothetical protein
MVAKAIEFEELINIKDPPGVIEEVKRIGSLLLPQFDFNQVQIVFDDIVRLFQGKYQGYRKCNTRYHDLEHTTNCLLVMARLMHGAYLQGISFGERDLTLGLISALMHDTGYIQLENDDRGTGGKYTLVHIERSVEFIEKYFEEKGYSLRDFVFCRNCLKCTGINVNVKAIHFESHEHETVGKILGVADLIGQMADRNYVPKLIFLYEEYREGGITMYNNELDLLKATPDFWEYTKQRFVVEFGNVDSYLRDHFRVYCGINRDLEREAIVRNIKCLKFILQNHESEYRKYLHCETL